MNFGQRVLVTGAGGFVCSNIIPVLLDSGWEVVALDRLFDPALKAEWGRRVTFVEAEAADLPPMQVDALIHGAAITASPEDLEQTPEANFRANLEPLLAALEWTRAQNVRRAIFLSSSAVFRESVPGAVTEDVPASPLGLYAVAKHTMETLVETLREGYGRDVAAVRLSNIYGIGERSRPTRPRISLVGKMIDEAMHTRKLTAYTESIARDWTFAPDIGRAIAALLQIPTLKCALYHVASGQTLTQVQIARAIQMLLPGGTLDLREGVDPNEAAVARRGYLSNQRLRNETGFSQWTPFLEGIKTVIEHQQKQEALR